MKMKKEEIFSFFSDETNLVIPDDTFIVYIQNIYSWDDLLNTYYSELKFPSYFGFNLNALYDCLSDFHWIKQKNIFIVHRGLPKFQVVGFKYYLDILGGAAIVWSEHPKVHVFKVFFDECYKEYIDGIAEEIDF